MLKRQLSLLLMLGVALIGSTACSPTQLQVTETSVDEKAPTTEISSRGLLGRGVNILGYDNYWVGKEDGFKIDDLSRLKEEGFTTVRINLRAFHFMDTAGVIDRSWLSKLDRVVAEALSRHFKVVLDEHDSDQCSAVPAQCSILLTSFWSQISSRYKGDYDSVFFELLNEPHGALTQQWNDLAGRLIKVVRSYTPSRVIIVGPVNNEAISGLSQLNLASYDKVIVSIHYYSPINFTHQGVSVNPATARLRGVTWGGGSDEASLQNNLRQAQAWGQAHSVRIWLGEFGVTSNADVRSRNAWISSVAHNASDLGWGWCYWGFGTSFSLLKPNGRNWNYDVIDALMGSHVPQTDR